jgi:hypothetical protein
MLREYRSAREYQRDAARLCRRGWEVVSVLERPSPPSRLERVAPGLGALLASPGREYLVTYRWLNVRGLPAPRPARRAARLARLRRWWWMPALTALGLLLLDGLVSFLRT